MRQKNNNQSFISSRQKLKDTCTRNLGALYLPNGSVERSGVCEESIHVESITDRAYMRLRHKEIQQQMNLEEVLAKVDTKTGSQVSEQEIDRDWASLYFNFIMDVSDSEMQSIWANTMIQELSKPGSISKCSLRFLHSLEVWEVRAFKRIAAYAFISKNGHPFLFKNDGIEISSSANNELGFDKRLLSHCVSAGLVRDESNPLTNGFEFDYNGEWQEVQTVDSSEASLSRFHIQTFSKIGSDLYKMVFPTIDKSRIKSQTEVWRVLSDFLHLKSIAGF